MGCLLTRVQHGRLLGLSVGEGAAHWLPLWLHIVPIYARLGARCQPLFPGARGGLSGR